MGDLLRVSCTTLETFRRWRDPGDDWTTEADVVAAIKRTTAFTRPMILGSALGEIIEAPEKFRKGYAANRPTDDFGCYVNRGVIFEAEQIDGFVLPLYDRRGPFEVKGTKQYGDVLVVAKVDQALGLQIIENKATASTFDFWKYADSAQWRFECDIFQCNRFTYRVFLIKDDADTGICEVRDCMEFDLYPYERLHNDCAALVAEFRDWVALRGLEPFLQQQQREAAAR